MPRLARWAACLWLASAGVAPGQWLPAQPVTWLGGRLIVSGDAAVSVSTGDDHTYFNYGDYQHDMMRLVRLGLAATLRLGAHAAVVADLRAEGEVTGGDWRGYPVTLVLQVRPAGGRSLAVGLGIVQPAFGAFTERRYGADNLLIGYPLAYQYTTAVRADALPATADEVLSNRGRGWAPSYSIGAGTELSGLPLVNAHGWSPGVSVSAGSGMLSARVAVTRGGLAAPGSASWDNPWEVTGRAEVRPTVGLVIGISGAHGGFVDESLAPEVATAAMNRQPRETAFGADLEYSWGYWLVRGETVVSRRRYPAFGSPYLLDPLAMVSLEGEARYKIRPGLYAAARLGALLFSQLRGSGAAASWDADVGRLETGIGYSFTHNVLLKGVYQYNWRDTTNKRTLHLGAAQLMVRF